MTLTEGNFAQIAHVVAFSERGPRGTSTRRPKNVHALENLLFLCPECHKLIDDAPDVHPRSQLESHKRDHEERIRYLTGLDRDHRTLVVQVKARINGHAVEIPISDVCRAVAPRYPAKRESFVIDLTAIHEERTSLLAARDEVRRECERLYAPGMDAERVRHISLFALAPIPLLVYLGTRLSNKISLDLYQRHRDTNDWVWKQDGDPVDYTITRLRKGRRHSRVAVVLSLSGAVSLERLPGNIDHTFTVYELTLGGRHPSTDFLSLREDLTRFESTYRELLAHVVREHPRAPEIHLFPAVPAPVAIACGHQLLPKAQPPLLVYDAIAQRGFIPQLRTDDHDA